MRTRERLDLVRRYRSIGLNAPQAAMLVALPRRVWARAAPVWRFRVDGLRFFATPSQVDGLEHVLLGGEYDVVADLVHGDVRPVVVDAGASTGTFALIVFRAAPGAVVHSLEPSPPAYRTLERNRRANPDLRWSTYNAALWSAEGEVAFRTNAEVPSRSRIEPGASELVRAVSLRRVLDDLAPTEPDLVKLDIEGAELEVLEAGEDALPRIRDLILQVHLDSVDLGRVRELLGRAFEHVYRLPGERRNPLLLASARAYDLPSEPAGRERA